MPSPDQIRIEQDRARPRITELWWALRPLTSVIRFMQTGAHPDDEISDMLAALTFRGGINLSYACSTRGEGGQNDIGTEAGTALGALRTREMERACDILGMRMYWHSETPEDPIIDFGFSKSGEETLGIWGENRTLARFVEIVRQDRPDIICPTFLDVPGQHGHHRAMTRAAEQVMTAAADPEFPSNLPVWQVAKLYLPAWSGAGQAYDDDEPPPPATMTIDGSGGDPISGWSWARIGQQSRAYHRTQGMGRWVGTAENTEAGRNWPLHLRKTFVPGPDDTLASGLPATLRDLTGLDGAAPIADHLTAAQDAIDAAVASFPDFDQIAGAAQRALNSIQSAKSQCPSDIADDMLHRLDAKIDQLGHVLKLALGVEFHGYAQDRFLVPGQSTQLELDIAKGNADKVEVAADFPVHWRYETGQLDIGGQAGEGDPYPDFYDPYAAQKPRATLSIQKGNDEFILPLPLEQTPVILPARQAELSPSAVLVNTASENRKITVQIGNVTPENGTWQLDTPDNWDVSYEAETATLTLPADIAQGTYNIPVLVDGLPAKTVQKIDYPHVVPTAISKPAELRLLVLTADLPDVRVGYIGAGNDRVGHWLAALGADVTELNDADLTSPTRLAEFDSIVIGVFAMRFRPGLAEAMPRLHSWVENGGTLVTLYHRPWDNWDPETIPPKRLEIGQPSLRWRVTDPNAEVTQLSDHPILSTPNHINAGDWAGWHKERGLYFAKSWDGAYTPLIEMSDPEEDPHQGALLVADIGKGRHIHTSLILHHQMEKLVPGAFRLMANFIAKRE